MGFFGSKGDGKRKVAIGFTIVTIVLVALALALPWYYEQTDVSFSGGNGCKQYVMRGWFMEYCRVYGGDDKSKCTDSICDNLNNAIILGGAKYPVNWRRRCDDSPLTSTDAQREKWCSLEKWYDVPFALCIIALACALGVTLISFYRGSYGSQARTVIATLESALLIVAVIVFAVGNSKWLDQYKPYSFLGRCADDPLIGNSADNCNKLWWSYNGQAHGPAGWYVAIGAALFAGIAQLLFMIA